MEFIEAEVFNPGKRREGAADPHRSSFGVLSSSSLPLNLALFQLEAQGFPAGVLGGEFTLEPGLLLGDLGVLLVG